MILFWGVAGATRLRLFSIVTMKVAKKLLENLEDSSVIATFALSLRQRVLLFIKFIRDEDKRIKTFAERKRMHPSKTGRKA